MWWVCRLNRQGLTVRVDRGAQAGQLLLNRLMMNLMGGRHGHVHGYSHRTPPAGVVQEGAGLLLPADWSVTIAEGVGMPDPSTAAHWLSRLSALRLCADRLSCRWVIVSLWEGQNPCL